MGAVLLVDGDRVYSACWEGLGRARYRQVSGELAGKFQEVSKEYTSHLTLEIWTRFSVFQWGLSPG